MEILDKMSRRMVCGIVLAALMLSALSQRNSYAQPNSQSPTEQAIGEFDHQLSESLLKHLHGGATNSIGIDYTPEARCSDNNWSTTTPVACNPQLSFTCTGNNPLSTCPSSCQNCYNDDLANLKNSLDLSTITSYQPNYYVLTTAQNLNIKVLQGLYNDAIPSLAAADSATDCTFAGQPIKLCGSKYAGALLDGACGTTTPWNPATFCGIAPNTGPYIEPLDYPIGPPGQFIKNGTIIAIQLGNEAIDTTVNGQVVTAQMISTAAQTLRSALDARGFKHIPIVVSLVLGQESTFCANGAPPTGVDFIAAHPYCQNVAGVPPSWPNNGTQCWQQVQTDFSTISQASCGAAHTFIGETGYNTGCPNSPKVPAGLISEEETFIANLKSSTCATSSQSGFPTFLFAYSDVCPSTGCSPGCSDTGLPREGNGYFGIFHTQDYKTEGSAIAKFPPPALVCSKALHHRRPQK
jgi:hypothetical protein